MGLETAMMQNGIKCGFLFVVSCFDYSTSYEDLKTLTIVLDLTTATENTTVYRPVLRSRRVIVKLNNLRFIFLCSVTESHSFHHT
jgi:hypothetical protein